MNLALTLMLGLAAQDDSMAVRPLLEQGDYAAAWERQAAEPDALRRARMRCEILYSAGDPAGALEAAREGLRHAPGDLELLHRACSAALWMGDSRAAEEEARELERALSQAVLAAENRPAWEENVRAFRRRAGELSAHEAMRDASAARARRTALVALVTAVGALLGLSAQGRSSRPVS